MDCIFCKIIAGKIKGHFVYEDDLHVAILDKYPVDKGHTLLIPKDHHEKIIDMEPNNVGNLFSKVPKVANAVLNATNADAFSLGQNNGKAAKQIIPHVHVHIIPRYNKTGPVWTRRTIATEEELSDLASKIKNQF